MRELEAILQVWRQHRASLDEAILATVVHVKGSAYRRPGARMLILSDGQRIGTISGGCLESSVAQKAAWWTSTTGTSVRHFDTTREDAAWEFGLGCNGVISVLLERCSNPSVAETLSFLSDILAGRGSGVIATVVRTDGGAGPALGDRLLIADGMPRGGELNGFSIEAEIIDAANEVAADQRSRLVRHDGFDLFIEWVKPPQPLVIFGAGHDAIPVNEMAQILGWNVTIADTRPGYARPERFPGADRVIALGRDADISQIEITSDAAVVVMTHNFPVDRLLLPQILGRNPPYLGLLGPRSRAEQLFRELGRAVDEFDVHAPVGLDLGGDGPQAIAVSIISEIQAVLNDRSAGPLRERARPIHNAAIELRVESSPRGRINRDLEAVVCETILAPNRV